MNFLTVLFGLAGWVGLAALLYTIRINLSVPRTLLKTTDVQHQAFFLLKRMVAACDVFLRPSSHCISSTAPDAGTSVHGSLYSFWHVGACAEQYKGKTAATCL
ncbi:hypothetical protein NPIL_273301 [Nephila pilipes]|uniref:Uncharacterized protein n=1 Tax=Nephila pilipes TaxID=299642 RepID=A0A8X6NJ05_NEPPI|nr:hypothetical protein NPIL_273301 [Nephila pilipes]